MPRPNPPRKRPRRRPDAAERAARAEVSLTRQTAQSQGQRDEAEVTAKPKAVARTPTVVPQADAPWTRRSYGILILVLIASEAVIGVIGYATLPSPRPDAPAYLLELNGNPIIVVLAALGAAPVARLITHERSLRFFETVVLGVIEYVVWLAIALAVGSLLSAAGIAVTGTTSTVPTPLANSSSGSTPSPTPTASGSSATPSASSGASNVIVVAKPTPALYAGLVAIDAASFVITLYIYPPIYRRFRMRPPPPRQRKPREPKP